MLRDLPFSALQFAFYEQFKRWSKIMRQQWKGSAKTLGNHVPWEVVNGLAAGGLAGLMTTPLGILPFTSAVDVTDVVKTRIQTATRSFPTKSHKIASNQLPLAAGFLTQPKNIRTESVIMALRYVYDHEGWRGLFRGMGPRSGWCGSQSGLMFLGYEFFLRMLEKWDSTHQDIGK